MAVSQLRVLRLIKRRVLEDIDNPQKIFTAEFVDDNGLVEPELSVYILESSPIEVTRIVSEHVAFSDADPSPKGALDITDLFTVLCEKQDDGGPFLLRRTAHHVLLYEIDPDDAMNMLTNFCSNPIGRIWETSAIQIREYGKRRYNQNDSEWLEASVNYPKVAKWIFKRNDMDLDIFSTHN